MLTDLFSSKNGLKIWHKVIIVVIWAVIPAIVTQFSKDNGSAKSRLTYFQYPSTSFNGSKVNAQIFRYKICNSGSKQLQNVRGVFSTDSSVKLVDFNCTASSNAIIVNTYAKSNQISIECKSLNANESLILSILIQNPSNTDFRFDLRSAGVTGVEAPTETTKASLQHPILNLMLGLMLITLIAGSIVLAHRSKKVMFCIAQF